MAAMLKSGGEKKRGEEEVWWYREQGSEGRTRVVHSHAGISWQEKLHKGDEMKVAAKQRRRQVVNEKK